MTREEIKKIYMKHYSSEKIGKYFHKKILLNKERTFNILYNPPFSSKERVLGAIFTSSNIRYGDFLEEITNKFLIENGAQIIADDNKNVDLYLSIGNKYYVGEIKIRDNHDSTKKKGQINNLLNKTKKTIIKYPGKDVHPLIYFIDPFEKKNHIFYREKLEENKSCGYNNYSVLFGDELFDLFQLKDQWSLIKDHLISINTEFKNNQFIINQIKSFINSKEYPEEIKREILSYFD